MIERERRRDFDAEWKREGRLYGWTMGLLLVAAVLFNIPPIFILGFVVLIPAGVCGYLAGADHKIYTDSK